MIVTVSGTPNSGTRLLCRLLVEGGITAHHDASHGALESPYPPVVVITRLAFAAGPQREDHIPSYSASLTNILRRYTFNTLWVTYEELCADQDRVIDRIADYLGVPYWQTKERCISQNKKWNLT